MMDIVKLEPIEEAIQIAHGINTGFSYSSNVASRFDKKQCDRLLEILYAIAYPETTLEEELDKLAKEGADTLCEVVQHQSAQELADELYHVTTISEQFQILVERAKENNLIIVYGASDDLCEFRGAYEDEICAYEGGTHLWNGKDFEVLPEGEYPDQDALYINQNYSDNDEVYWAFKTNIKNTVKVTFKEDDYLSEGLVIPMSSLFKGDN